MTDKTIVSDKTKTVAGQFVDNITGDITVQASQPQHVEVSSDDFVLKGKNYHNIKCLSNSSGEAQVYLTSYGKQDYVLKIYYPNYKLNKTVSKIIYNMDFEMVMKICDFGSTYFDGSRRDYELMEYLEGGTLAEYKLDRDMTQFRRIALQCAGALQYVHTLGIIHKDIKPTNFFFRDEKHTQVVLGDFGISSSFDDEESVVRTTQARTPAYAAPEMYTNVIDGEVEITPAVDYYSLGITLLSLWLGRDALSTNERAMMRQKAEGKLPHIDELPDRVKMIIQGLTTVNAQTRWGFDEVERWFKGDNVEVDLSSPYLNYKDFIVDPDRNLVASNPKELARLFYENQKMAVTYLYNHRVSKWLESCGNEKTSLKIEEIIKDIFPADQKAGLMESLYTLDSQFPYHDVNGDVCGDIHSVCISLLNNVTAYSLVLRNPNDDLFLYIDAHTDCNVYRLRSYFKKDKNFDGRVAILKLIYEIDPEIPFLAKYPSSTLKEISESFGKCDVSDDDWTSLCDGRLLAWMYCHEDKMACESIRIMTENQPNTRSFGYKILYNIDRDAAFDLKEAKSPASVGELMNLRLQECQHLNNKDFTREMDDFINLDGRLFYYAQMHGWYDQVSEGNRCFNLRSDENRNRMSAYDIKTAAYRFCMILGVTPKYMISSLTVLNDGRNISKKYVSEIRSEIRNGNFTQWLSIFYHENPKTDFSETYSYERTLEKWLNKLGEYDASQVYYKRFVAAREETDKQINEARNLWRHASDKEKIWNTMFYGLCVAWFIMLLFIGIPDNSRRYLMEHTVFSIGVPLGLCTALICAVHSYFRGLGFSLSAVLSFLGFATSAIPIMILREVYKGVPSLFIPTVIILTLVYIVLCYLTNYRRNSNDDKVAINEALDDDIKSSLLEPLYYTFKTKSYKYKGSKFAMLQDVSDHVRSMAGESVVHYACWSLLIFIFVFEFMLFNPHTLNTKTPNLPTWRIDYQEVIQKLKHDVE